MPQISIVIVNYNTREHLRECLDSILRECSTFDLEVLVVDNGSVDGSADMVREYDTALIKLIAPDDNTWFTGGNNLGMMHATGDLIWILNPDTIVQPRTLPTMMSYLEANPQVGAVTCRMEFPQGGLQRTCSQMPHYLDLLLGYTFVGVLLAPLRDRRRQRMWYAAWERNSTRPVEVAPGSNILAQRQMLQDVGYFDTAMKLYFCEDDLCERIREGGYEIHFVSGTELLHHEHASVKQVQRLASRLYWEDLLVFCAKHFGRPQAWLLALLMLPTRWGMSLMQRWRGERTTLDATDETASL